MAEKKYQCPECGNGLTLRGLHGHLRFVHGYDDDAAREVLQSPIPAAMSMDEKREGYYRILELLERRRDLDDLIELVGDEELIEHRVIHPEVLTELDSWIVDEANAVLDELRELTGLDELGYPIKKGAKGSSEKEPKRQGKAVKSGRSSRQKKK